MASQIHSERDWKNNQRINNQIWSLLFLLVASLAIGELIWRYCFIPLKPNFPGASLLEKICSLQTENKPPAWVRTYYVDTSLGTDSANCSEAQNPNTPMKTISGILNCYPGPGQTVLIKGNFTETIFPNRSGLILYEVQDIVKVKGSVVVFKQRIRNLYSPTDYVAIYGSRKGNSGAYQVISVFGNHVTVDTSDLPGGEFLRETMSDPGNLQAAILRPVHFTAWDKNNPPVFTGLYQAYQVKNQSVIMVSHIKSIAGNSVNPGFYVWPAFEIDGNDNGVSDFQIFDHLEVYNAESAIAIESNEFQSNYDILQFNTLSNIGFAGDVSDEIIYFGYAYRPDLHHDFVQIMYNKIGPHNGPGNLGDGIEIKPSAHNATIFGNEVVGIQSQGCDDAPIKIAGIDAFVANNYVHDINPQLSKGCGIAVIDDTPLDPTSGAKRAIVVNNIVADVQGVGIKLLDVTGVKIFNNTIYNIFPQKECDTDCMEQVMGIEVHNWQGDILDVEIKNNIVQKSHIGIGRYYGSHDEFKIEIESDFNIIFDTIYPFRGTIKQNTHDLLQDPLLIGPEKQDYKITSDSPARDSGTSLPAYFRIDNHNATYPSLTDITPCMFRGYSWDRGAYEIRNSLIQIR